jgi:hypothetical protein
MASIELPNKRLQHRCASFHWTAKTTGNEEMKAMKLVVEIILIYEVKIKLQAVECLYGLCMSYLVLFLI